ncbi:MAG: hypothetical protein SV062_00755 [Thermodesulfobacteriota bacterium]|nr:hypothetical protein [Thermodesulfobacteriota bacterium]
MARIFISLTYALIFFYLTNFAFAGAWTMEKGKMYNKFSINYFYSEKNFDGNGHLYSLPNDGGFYDFNLTWYQEYGLSDRVAIISSVPYKHLHYEDDDFKSDSWGVGDIEAGIKFCLLKKPFVLSLQSKVKIPEAYDENEDVPLGNGQWDGELRVLLGKSLWPTPAYFGMEGGYMWRAEAPADEFKYLFEFGYSLSERFSLRTKLDGTLSIDNADIVTTSYGNPQLGYEYDLGKLELTATYKMIKNIFMEFTYTPYVYGKAVSAGNNFSLAVWWTL